VGGAALAMAACGGSSAGAGAPDASPDDGGPTGDATSPQDGPASPDASDAGGSDGAAESTGPSDGTPSYTSSCTPLSQQNGTAVNTYHGRLDGYLAYVVPKGGSGACNGDDSHVHLQVRMMNNIYDVAVDIGKFAGDVFFDESDVALPDGAWAEGWHGSDNLTYTALGLHAGQFTSEDPTALGQKIQAELMNANHISVFCIGYMQGNGCHDVHYHNGASDGAIVIHPLSAPAHVLFFRFAADSF
jgi:hypothetical protein